MGADVLVVRHRSTGVPQQLAQDLQQVGERTVVLNGGDGLIVIPVRLLICSLARISRPSTPCRNAARPPDCDCRRHPSLAARSTLGFDYRGADVVLCGPPSLVPEDFSAFVDAPPLVCRDPVPQRGKVSRCGAWRMHCRRRCHEEPAASEGTMGQQLLTSLERYHRDLAEP